MVLVNDNNAQVDGMEVLVAPSNCAFCRRLEYDATTACLSEELVPGWHAKDVTIKARGVIRAVVA